MFLELFISVVFSLSSIFAKIGCVLAIELVATVGWESGLHYPIYIQAANKEYVEKSIPSILPYSNIHSQ